MSTDGGHWWWETGEYGSSGYMTYTCKKCGCSCTSHGRPRSVNGWVQMKRGDGHCIDTEIPSNCQTAKKLRQVEEVMKP